MLARAVHATSTMGDSALVQFIVQAVVQMMGGQS